MVLKIDCKLRKRIDEVKESNIILFIVPQIFDI